MMVVSPILASTDLFLNPSASSSNWSIAPIRSASDQESNSSISDAGRSRPYRASTMPCMTSRMSFVSASETRSLDPGKASNISFSSPNLSAILRWSLSITLPDESAFRLSMSLCSSSTSDSSSSQHLSSMTSMRLSADSRHCCILLSACESSHIPGCSFRNSLVGTPSLMMPSSIVGSSEKDLIIPLRTCSTELLVGANTATFWPASRQARMHVASTNCVFPVPGAPQT